jgi:hypothetical protein
MFPITVGLSDVLAVLVVAGLLLFFLFIFLIFPDGRPKPKPLDLSGKGAFPPGLDGILYILPNDTTFKILKCNKCNKRDEVIF